METLNREELLLISLQLKVSDVLKWGKANKVINRKVCQSEDVWRRLILRDFLRDFPSFTFKNSPKLGAKNLYTLFYTLKVWDLNLYRNIDALYHAVKLQINTTNVRTIPANLNLPNLQVLNLSNNSINHIPDILKLENLRELYLDYNELKVIPMHINFPNLKILGFAHNLIACVPWCLDLVFPKLEQLDLYGNHIKWVPDDLIMINLRWVRFSILEIENLTHFIKNNPCASIDLI